jgi:hypothetical protein
MTLEQRVLSLAQAIAGDIKQLRIERGTLSGLSTTEKGNLVAAINEIYALANAGGSEINDAAATNSTIATYSASKITTLIANAVTSILGGASAAYDTLVEIQGLLQGDASSISGLLTAVGNRVAFDAAQSLSDSQKLQACNNIGVGNYDRNFVADYTTARDA